ncbi:hypothetical protein [Polaromonas sp.]|uniref:hypothetical protein n=1 Tax=Polaromonas sp. TaxID=1869339 RepID=UPI002FC76850
MSFDFYLYRAAADSGPMTEWKENRAEALGSADDVRLQLAQLFPLLRWEQHSDGSWSATSPHDGNAPRELALRETEPGVLHFVVVYAGPSVLRQLMQALRLTHCCAPESGEMRDPFAVDEQWKPV